MADDDPHHIETMYDWFKYSVSKVPPHIITPEAKRKWDLEYVKPFGRVTIATQDIKEGEVIFVDHPVATGPKQNCGIICLGCYKNLESPKNVYNCSKCSWPLCGPQCETKGYHPVECGLYAQANYKPNLDDVIEEQHLYESCLPLRCYGLSTHDPDKWKTLIAMQSHDDLRRGTELWEREQVNVVEFLTEKVKIPVSGDLLHTITGVLDVNCHEVRSNIPDGSRDEYRVRGIYPLTAMMSHFCSNNTHHTLMEDMTMVVMASRPIKKGQQITATYTHILSATSERRKHLKYGKFFDCICDRCCDPTELGTYYGALACSQPGCEGNILCTNPICPNNEAPWRCDRCKYQIPSETVERLNKIVYWELRQINENDPIGLETIFKKYQNVFHPQHFHLIGIKHSLSQTYGRVPGYLMQELSDAHLLRKLECCRDLLRVLDVLDPGISRLRGLTYYEMHAVVLLQTNKAFRAGNLTRKEFMENLHEGEGYVIKAISSLQYEPVASFEGEICKISKTSLKELKSWITQGKDLPSSHFLPEKEDIRPAILSEEDLTLEGLLRQLEGE